MLKRALLSIAVTSSSILAGCSRDTQQQIQEHSKRLVMDLNGTWEIAAGDMDSVLAVFDRKVPVPGLVDMARPSFQDGVLVSPNVYPG
jgi:hypothetical protein